MKISARYYPAIILVTFIVFLLIGFLLGFRPRHEGGRGREGSISAIQYVLVESEMLT